MNTTEPRDVESNTGRDGDTPPEPQQQRRQRSSIPSFIFISFALYMLTSSHGDESAIRDRYIDGVNSLNEQLSNYTAWRNGSETNYTMLDRDNTTMPLVNSFMTFGSRLDPKHDSYYTNLTGFWRGDLAFHNISFLDSEHPPSTTNGTAIPWLSVAKDYVEAANLTANATEYQERIGAWNWTASYKLSLSIGDKLLWAKPSLTNVSTNIAMIHGKIDLSDPDKSEEFRLDFDGVHSISNGTIFAFAEPSGRGIDIRDIPALLPEEFINETARVVEVELSNRISKLQDKIDNGAMEDYNESDQPKSKCSFAFFAQLNTTHISAQHLKELEDEIDEPTGISTVSPPPLMLNGVLVSKSCGMLYEIKETKGLKTQSLYRKITTYAGISTIVNGLLLILLTRQISRSRSAAGLSRVSRYPFLAQSLIDAISFVGHITLAILAQGKPSITVVAPAGLACILFIYEAQFAVLIGQIQAPEDDQPPAPRPPTPPPAPTPPQLETAPNAEDPATPSTGDAETRPLLPPTPPRPPTPTPPPPPSFWRFFIHHIRTDPSARIWLFMSFVMLVVFRVVLILSLPLLFIGAMYSFMWTAQIWRSIRRGRTSGLSAEYLIGVTACRLFFILYVLGCPHNILEVEPRSWIYLVAAFMGLQISVILLQEVFGPSFFVPGNVTKRETYDYHPPMPLPDPESPEQSLGDCAICMDAILVDPSSRQHRHDDNEKGEKGALHLGGSLFSQANARKSYSLAPCHHLFHTVCLERWLAIKNICPQCRRALPPL